MLAGVVVHMELTMPGIGDFARVGFACDVHVRQAAHDPDIGLPIRGMRICEMQI